MIYIQTVNYLYVSCLAIGKEDIFLLLSKLRLALNSLFSSLSSILGFDIVKKELASKKGFFKLLFFLPHF